MVNPNGDFLCDCGMNQRFGFPCRHLIHVYIYYGTDFENILPEHVDIRFHTDYGRYVATLPREELCDGGLAIRNNLMSLRCCQPIMLAESVVLKEMCNNTAKGSNVQFTGDIRIHILDVKKISPQVTNYELSEVIAARETHVLGKSYYEESHLCGDKHTDSLLQIWNDVDLQSPVSKEDDIPVYDYISSQCQELTRLYDGASPSAMKRLKEAMDALIGGRKKN